LEAKNYVKFINTKYCITDAKVNYFIFFFCNNFLITFIQRIIATVYKHKERGKQNFTVKAITYELIKEKIMDGTCPLTISIINSVVLKLTSGEYSKDQLEC
jgi:hypothetical protein